MSLFSFLFGRKERKPRKSHRTPDPLEPVTKPRGAYWRRHLRQINEAIQIIEKHSGVKIDYEVTMPPPPVAEMNDRIEEQLLRLGIPGDVHASLSSTLTHFAFSKEIEDKTVEAAAKAGLEFEEDAEISDEDEKKIWNLQAQISLQKLCQIIGVETNKVEAAEVVEGTREWADGDTKEGG